MRLKNILLKIWFLTFINVYLHKFKLNRKWIVLTMVEVKNIGKINDYVYDISLDGSVVNALGMNVAKQTDGMNFKIPDILRYTEEHPYISTGLGRNSKKGKTYIGVEGDVAEFEDLYFTHAFNGGVNKMGLGVDEYCTSTINFSRKNYADMLAGGKTKKVGNTIKSRKMSGYIEKFLDAGIDMLLNGDGQSFLESYYDYIDRIFNYRIPLKDIASKGKIKKTLEAYKKDCNTVTKAGSKKSRQCWYELAIVNNLKVNIDDTIYYINTGTKKSETDVKRITHQFVKRDGEVVELTNKIKKELLLLEFGSDCDLKTIPTKTKNEVIKRHVVREEDEIILNCKIVPSEIVNSEDDVMCNDDIEYNVVKYIDQFNNRITPLLVCFSKDIRDRILVKNPNDRQYFTKEECALVSGEPSKESDQDTIEQLMSLERKEMEFWTSINEKPPFVDECGIDWDKSLKEFNELKKMEESELFKEEDRKYTDALNKLTQDDIDTFYSDGILPKSLTDIVMLDSDMKFKFIKIPNMSPSTGGYVFDDLFIGENLEKEFENEQIC